MHKECNSKYNTIQWRTFLQQHHHCRTHFLSFGVLLHLPLSHHFKRMFHKGNVLQTLHYFTSLLGKGNQGTYALLVFLVGLSPKVANADVCTGAVILVLTLLLTLWAKSYVAKEQPVEQVALRQSGLYETFFSLINKL